MEEGFFEALLRVTPGCKMLVTSIKSLPLKDTYGRLKMVMTAVHKTGAKVRVEIWAFPKGSEF